MGDTRNNKTSRGRIHRSTRAIFYENLQRGIRLMFPEPKQKPKIQWLIKHAHISRSHAQRFIDEKRNPDTEQAPNLDTVAFVAEAFGVTTAEFLTQGCKFNEKHLLQAKSDIAPLAAFDADSLHRPKGRVAAKRRSE